LLPPDEATNRLTLIMRLALQLRDYPKAILFANRAIASTLEPDPEAFGFLGQAQYLSGDYKSAAASMAQALERARKAGKPVVESWLQVQLSSHGQLRDVAGVLSTLKELAVAFPKKKNLQDLFTQWKHEKSDDRNLLNLYRLMFELQLLQNAEDYLRLAQLAVDMGLPGEAIQVLERGKADKKFTDEVDQEHARRQLQAARTAAVADRKTLASLEESTQSNSGEDEVQRGVALASYQQYDEAVAALERGIAKGGIKRPDQANLSLGQTLVKLNRPAEAQAAFEKVEKSSPLSVVAQLWRIYTAQPSPLGT
jgi:tetratricopeptide (TPR) repeat protein